MNKVKQFVLACLLMLLCILGHTSYAQQDAQFSHYMFNHLYYNPAVAGMDYLDYKEEKRTRISLLYRTQWLGYETTNVDDREGGSPVTQNILVSHPLKSGTGENRNVIGGIGLQLINDKLGPLSNFNLKLSYSHHVQLPSLGGKLGIGVKAGFWRKSINGSLLRPSQANDPLVEQIGDNTVSQLRPDFGVGLWYKENQGKYYGGISVNHIVKSDFDFGVDPDVIDTKLTQHVFITGGYNLDVNSNIKLSPSFIIQSDLAETDFNLGALATYDTRIKNSYWVGLTLRQSIVDGDVDLKGKSWSLDDFIIIAGLGALRDDQGVNRLKLGYAFDLVLSGRGAKNPTSHEIMLGFLLPESFASGRPPLFTPRYKHTK